MIQCMKAEAGGAPTRRAGLLPKSPCLRTVQGASSGCCKSVFVQFDCCFKLAAKSFAELFCSAGFHQEDHVAFSPQMGQLDFDGCICRVDFRRRCGGRHRHQAFLRR
jgi:hypothetical protein